MSQTSTITTGDGIIRHYNAIVTEPWILCTDLEFHDCKAPKLILHEDDCQFI